MRGARATLRFPADKREERAVRKEKGARNPSIPKSEKAANHRAGRESATFLTAFSCWGALTLD